MVKKIIRLKQKKYIENHTDIIIKLLNINAKERVLNSHREKGHITYRGTKLRKTTDVRSQLN